MKWKVLSSERLFDRPWLKVRREHCLLPDGREHKEYYILDYPDWINIIALTEAGEMLLVRQYRHGLGETHFELVAGCVEEGESALAAAKRELLEETGYGEGEWQQWLYQAPNPATQPNHATTFLVRGVRRVADEQKLDATEDIEVHLLSREQVWQMVQSGEIVQSIMLAPLYKYFMEYPCK